MRKRSNLKAFLLQLAVLALLVPFASAAQQAEQKAPKQEKGVIAGQVMTKGDGPLADGQVMFYNSASGPAPAPEKFERTPDYVRGLDSEGRFEVELPAGTYYIRAVKRASGEVVGPPSPGDPVLRVQDESGRPKPFVIESEKRLDVGLLGSAEPLKADTTHIVTTAIEGTVLDTMGKPVANAVVVAFLKPAVMSKPLFISEKTGKDGKYLLRLTAGTYYLRVRNEFASGPPEPGQIVGYYGEGQPAPITVKDGQVLKSINFVVILFPGRGPFSGTVPEQ